VSERRDQAIAPLVSIATLARRIGRSIAQASTACRPLALGLPRGLAQLAAGPAVVRRFIAHHAVVPRRAPISRPLLALNLLFAGLSIFCFIRLGLALFAPDPSSPVGIARSIATAAPRNHDAAPRSRRAGAYDLIATRTLFHPSRSEPTPSEAIIPIVPPAPTLELHGVVISDDTRFAFLQDVVTNQIFGCKTGDRVAGGQVERIEPDRVVIMRADGPFEVVLRRPRGPQPAVLSPDEAAPRRSRGRQE